MPDRPRLASIAARIATYALLAASATAGATAAAAPPSAPVRAVRLERPSASVPSTGTMRFDIVADLEPATTYVDMRIRLKRPNGKLLYQRTRVFRAEATSSVRATFERPLADLDLPEGRYPIEVRIRAEAGARTGDAEFEDRLLVYDPATGKTPLAMVVKIACAPALDPSGRFVGDMDDSNAALESAVAAARLAADPDERLTLAIAPVIVEQWRRTAVGYQTAGPAGVTDVPATDPTARDATDGLEALSEALGSPRVELLDVPYADPDLPGLVDIGAVRDLDRHFARGRSTYAAALQATPSAGTMPAEGVLPPEAGAVVAANQVGYAVLSPRSFAGPRGLAAGTWAIGGSNIAAVLADPPLSAAAGSRGATRAVAIDRLFELRGSLGATSPVAAVVEIGAGHPADTGGLAAFLDEAAASGWVRLELASEAASAPPRGTLRLAPDRAGPGSGAPDGYWEDVAEARIHAGALDSAAGAADKDADAAVWSLLLAESRCWAGADDAWALADRGRAFADAAVRGSSAVFDQVRLAVSDLTLSGSAGRVPLVVTNASDKTLALQVRSESPGLIVGEPSQTVVAAPGDNYATVPVDLSGAISADLAIRLSADALEVDRADVAVKASILDRLVIVGAVIVVLAALLFYLWRSPAGPGGSLRRGADAGRIRVSDGSAEGADGSDGDDGSC